MKKLNFLSLALVISFLILFTQDNGWAQQEVEFNFTGGQQSFVVPPGVSSIHIQAWGAEGATVIPEAPGGLGGYAEGDLNVTPGQTLQIFVGGQGCVQTINQVLGCGGFNGGGDAGGIVDGRGGGGGASDVRVDGATFNDRVIVAAGGGGGCETSDYPGGNGGGLEGDQSDIFQPGFGGTQSLGGAGFNNPTTCLDGGFGFGGSSGAGFSCAGGGGGWYGGGSGCGGGGGSSYIDGVANGNTESGVREGNGLVILTFTPISPIPTLSEWGLLAMAVVFGISGLMVARRRKAAA